MELKGLVRKGVGGFYHVETEDGIYICTARGRFRKDQISPCAGDEVLINCEADNTGCIITIYPRRNYLVRPFLANIDRLFIVSSVCDPQPDPLMIDKTVAAAEIKGIEPVVVFTKSDLQSTGGLEKAYITAGISCFVVSSASGAGIDRIRSLLSQKISAFTGNSGVGKSSLLNALFPDLELKTGEISQKLGRGRHTTREVELYDIGGGGYVADTPGFSTFDMEKYELIEKEQLVYGFRELLPFLGKCKFSSCSHTCEKGCSVIDAVENGVIARSRWNSYCTMYNEIKDIKQWQKNKNA